MPPANASAASSVEPSPAGEQVLGDYLAALAARGAGNRSFSGAARVFLARWPNPQTWADQPLPIRLSASSATRPLLNYLIVGVRPHMSVGVRPDVSVSAW